MKDFEKLTIMAKALVSTMRFATINRIDINRISDFEGYKATVYITDSREEFADTLLTYEIFNNGEIKKYENVDN